MSPNREDEGSWIYQNAWMHLGDFSQETNTSYTLGSPSNGVYVFIIDGSLEIERHTLNKRDALGVWDTNSIDFKIAKNSRVLLIDVPLKF